MHIRRLHMRGFKSEEIGFPERLPDVIELRDNAIAASVARGNGPDDFKFAAGEFYVARQPPCSHGGWKLD